MRWSSRTLVNQVGKVRINDHLGKLYGMQLSVVFFCDFLISRPHPFYRGIYRLLKSKGGPNGRLPVTAASEYAFTISPISA